ncbi:hypothetical protein ARTHRO_11277 [Limnospira indica PCC 8005]|uniref:Uncharacterized protein n=1 Tax=Limnospira indica PCC 8005 TaxID=376219 RepID=A0A9P1KCN0_9CYAN|nr:hypothetical protein ARTHRO_11277 [Limnospira indica PCC 8005]
MRGVQPLRGFESLPLRSQLTWWGKTNKAMSLLPNVCKQLPIHTDKYLG